MEALKSQLLAKEPEAWDLKDVSDWLDALGLGEYRIPFVENSVTGAELMDIDTDDLNSLGVTKLGHKKRILRSIKKLRKREDPFDVMSEKSSEHSSDDSSSQHSGSSRSIPPIFKAKCTFNGETRIIEFEEVDGVDDLRLRLIQEFKCDVVVKYQDEEGDMIAIGSDKELAYAVKDGTIRLHLFPAAFLSDAEQRQYNQSPEAVVIIDRKGHIQFFNKAAEQMFGHSSADVADKNVTCLMNKHDAKHHRKYIKSYLKTGEAKVIGKGRTVAAKRADGSKFAVRLTLQEKREGPKIMFIGSMREVDERGAAEKKAQLEAVNKAVTERFAMLDTLLDPAVVINDKGAIMFFNTAAVKLWGYDSRADVEGRNCSLLMPEPFRSEHSAYIENYKRSRVSKIIGTGRDVPIQLRAGDIKPMHLKLSQTTIDANEYFTAILSEPRDGAAQKSTLQLEREVLEGLAVPGIIIDNKGVIQAFNKGSEQLFGYKLAEVIGKNVKILMNEEDAAKHDDYLHKYCKGGPARIIGKGRKVLIRKKDSSYENVMLWVNEKREASGKRYFSGILQPESDD